MSYCITLRSRPDALITGWYDGSDSRWSTDRYRQKVFDNKRDARPVCDELRSLCPRNAEVINIEAEQDAPSLDEVPGSRASGCIYGAPSITKARSLTSWFSAGEAGALPSGACAS
jgi:hypothetical protein